jgi:hypothetical protein
VDEPPPDGGAVEPRSRGRRIAAGVLTALAALLVFLALVAPNQIPRYTPLSLVRIPIEGLVAAAVLVVLPARARRVVAIALGVLLGLLTIVKIVDVGFYSVLNRPFNLVLDWILFGDAFDWLSASFGRAGAIGTLVLAVLIIVGVLVFMTLAVRRLTRIALRHKTSVLRGTTVLAVVWLVCALTGAALASAGAAGLVYDRAVQIHAGIVDKKAFTAQAAVDPYRDTPGNQLLTGLRGKDVIITIIESYGRVAVQDPAVDSVLDAGTRELAGAGYSARSGFLTSSTFGANSWLAHGTFFSGLRIDNQQRYNTLVASDRLTLSKAFQKAGWRTVAVMPGTIGPWNEDRFYGLDKVYADKDLGYRGPAFSWSTMPDQYTFSAFQRLEYATPGRGPLMAEIVTVSSHAPWEPIPRLLPWSAVGDGSVYDPSATKGDLPEAIVHMDPTQVRANYMLSVQYALNTLISYVKTYGNDNMVMVFFGDHQPSPIVSGNGATHDVPVTIVARDPSVLDRVSSWHWSDGLRPDPNAPVWPMESFRDKFLTAFGSQAR